MLNLDQKFEKLENTLISLKSVMIAYSGGVDSTLLLKAAKEVLGDSVIAVTAVSPLYPAHEIEQAVNLASSLQVKHLTIQNDSLSNDAFTKNSPDRCYICKKSLFKQVKSLAAKNNCDAVVDGTNADDVGTYRPGMQALKELNIKSPLKDAGMSKEDIRLLSKQYGLNTWNRPSYACLASRFPYGVKLNEADLVKVEKAEACLRNLNDVQLRVRHYGDTARIEVFLQDLNFYLEDKNKNEIITTFKKIGYTYITFDLEGFRSGSMDEVL